MADTKKKTKSKTRKALFQVNKNYKGLGIEGFEKFFKSRKEWKEEHDNWMTYWEQIK